MIFEDAHWTDPTSLEVFSRVVDWIKTLPVLLFVTFRPEFQAPWIGLTERDTSAMIDRLVGNKPLSASIRQDIIERTDGIPLFVEEMTKAVLETESEADVQRTVAAVPSPTPCPKGARPSQLGQLRCSAAPTAPAGSWRYRRTRSQGFRRSGREAAQRSVERSALVEAIEQLTRALAQIATLPATRSLRREEIKLQVALITPLFNIKGFAAAETKAATERARLLIEQAEALGEPLEDPLLLFSVLFGFWIANFVAFNGEVLRELAAQFLALAERQGATAPLMIGHHMMGNSLAAMGDVAQGRAHYDQALVPYDPAVHRPLATRFSGADIRVGILSFRSWALWMLGYPDAALADAEHALEDAREIGQAATLMLALSYAGLTKSVRGNYAAANALGGGTCRVGGPKTRSDLESIRNEYARSRVGSDWQSCRRNPNDHLGAYRKSFKETDPF
jgi:tetratricopeptide (TPR) repeat protein